jgi:hypothetical protein
MSAETRVVDNRVFVLGLDKLYRDAMKAHESGELLGCARRLAATLRVPPADVPVEGYYVESRRLTEYFRLIRALQTVGGGATPSVASLPEFQRLHEVMSAPLYGRPEDTDRLLPAGRDALSQALLDTFPDWTVAGLTAAACKTARHTDDISLVGVAARVQDTVVLAAARESVVLYAVAPTGAARHPRRPQYVWNVDEEVAESASRFIDTFNALFDGELPAADPEQAERYWHAYRGSHILGRCVRLGVDDRALPMRHYHWAVCRAADGELAVQEFWNLEVWTTGRYRAALLGAGECPDL